MKTCVIFACSIFNQSRLSVLTELLDTFKLHFHECDFYIGINPGSISDVENVIESYQLNVKGIGRVSELLYNHSDASAYQLALKYLHDSKQSYDTSWFVHTKGGVNSYSDYLRKWYIDNLLSARTHIDSFLNNEPNVGSYGLLGLEFREQHYSEQDTEIKLFENVITDDLPVEHAPFFYIHTLYVIKYSLVIKFFSIITDVWFNSKLDRYYFEGIFPFIVSRSGMFPYLENTTSMNNAPILSLVEAWVTRNNLDKLRPCLSLPTKSYHFDQLMPPYVTSNT